MKDTDPSLVQTLEFLKGKISASKTTYVYYADGYSGWKSASIYTWSYEPISFSECKIEYRVKSKREAYSTYTTSLTSDLTDEEVDIYSVLLKEMNPSSIVVEKL